MNIRSKGEFQLGDTQPRGELVRLPSTLNEVFFSSLLGLIKK